MHTPTNTESAIRNIDDVYKRIENILRQTELKDLKEKEISEKMGPINAAYIISKHMHATQSRRTGERYFEHIKGVVDIVVEEFPNTMSVEMILTAFLHDVAEDTPFSVDMIRTVFGDTVADGVDALTKKEYPDYMNIQEREIFDNMDQEAQENYIRENKPRLKKQKADVYFSNLTNQRDEVLYCKYADRLHNLRSLPPHEHDKIQDQIQETVQYIFPIAYQRNHTDALDLLQKEIIRLSKHLTEQELGKVLG